MIRIVIRPDVPFLTAAYLIKLCNALGISCRQAPSWDYWTGERPQPPANG